MLSPPEDVVLLLLRPPPVSSLLHVVEFSSGCMAPLPNASLHYTFSGQWRSLMKLWFLLIEESDCFWRKCCRSWKIDDVKSYTCSHNFCRTVLLTGNHWDSLWIESLFLIFWWKRGPGEFLLWEESPHQKSGGLAGIFSELHTLMLVPGCVAMTARHLFHYPQRGFKYIPLRGRSSHTLSHWFVMGSWPVT